MSVYRTIGPTLVKGPETVQTTHNRTVSNDILSNNKLVLPIELLHAKSNNLGFVQADQPGHPSSLHKELRQFKSNRITCPCDLYPLTP